MKRLLLVVSAVALVAGFVGCPSTPAEKKAEVAKLPDVANQPLTEEEIVTLVKAAPAVGAALKAANFAPTEPKEDDQIAVIVTRFVDEMKPVAGVEAALTAAGTNWDAFRGTMLKIAAAQAKMSSKMVSAFAEEMRKDTTAEAKKGVAQIDALVAAVANVPDANVEMVMKHQKDLEVLNTFAKSDAPAEAPTGTPEEKPAEKPIEKPTGK
jgi:hypothetical protein